VPGGIYHFDENKKNRRIKLVLDGQQRLRSIYVALNRTFHCLRLESRVGTELWVIFLCNSVSM
jgi:uncharacterized protein with ParB-like and HNH nuclease domain